MRARAASSRTKTATITAKKSELGYMAYGHCPYDVGRRSHDVVNVSRQSHPPLGAIHVSHDPLRRPRLRSCRRHCLLELGYRTHGRSEVHSPVTEQLAIVRVARLHQS
jgi:hypothetical protein